jgi:riboflavin synthase
VFTGIIETTGKVVRSTAVPGGRKLTIDAGCVADDAIDGASIAVNGVCLTVAAKRGTQLDFDVIQETLATTSLGALTEGSHVNLERSLTPTSRLDGHFVQGHVDGLATLVERVSTPREEVLWFAADEPLRAYLIPKGSVAIDGISLTIAAVEPARFSVALIPTTLQRTTLESRQVGDRVNIETDIIARTIVHHLRGLGQSGWAGQEGGHGGMTVENLREQGYA